MSFLCNVAAGQHTPKSILESPEPRNVILAPALSCHGAATVAATVAATAAATVAATVAATAAATGRGWGYNEFGC